MDETPKEAGVQSSVMETQADVTRNFGSLSANVLVPLQISAPSTHAHPKLLPRSVMAVEKVMADLSEFLFLTCGISGLVTVKVQRIKCPSIVVT